MTPLIVVRHAVSFEILGRNGMFQVGFTSCQNKLCNSCGLHGCRLVLLVRPCVVLSDTVLLIVVYHYFPFSVIFRCSTLNVQLYMSLS